ncbi:MAG: GvpL/GvpF family gas vesicle protein, partial [Terriglobales bacterium]
MSLLLYCVAPEAVGETGARGVGGSAVGSEVRDGLRYFLSEANEGSTDLAVAAREVLGVIQDVFSRGPVLPFRYPTILKDELELNKLAAERGTAFAQFLAWVGQRVQMDVRIMREETKGPSAAAAKSGPPALGMTDTSGRVTGETPVLR